MVLKANGNRDGFGCVQHYGAGTLGNGSYPSTTLGNSNQTGKMRNLYGGGISDTSSLPDGNLHPSAWMLAPKSGGIASRNIIVGLGDISASILAVKLAQASISGSGDLTAFGGLIVQLIADLVGDGDVTAADIKAFLAASANLTGSGDAEGLISALGDLLSNIDGLGDIVSTLTALGELDADLVVTGTGLSTANVGQAVWQEILEAGYSAEQIMKIMAAVLAGTVSGAETSTVTFKGIDGSTDRVISDTDANGNRLSVTLDGS